MKNYLHTFLVLLAFADTMAAADDLCGVSFESQMVRNFNPGDSKTYKVTFIDGNVREISPGHYVSDDPKGGSIWVEIGQDMATQGTGSFSNSKAIIPFSIIQEWQQAAPKYSFRYKIRKNLNARIVPSPAPRFTSPDTLRFPVMGWATTCANKNQRNRQLWRDAVAWVDKYSGWSPQVNSSWTTGTAGSNPYKQSIYVSNPSSQYSFSFSENFPFDPSYCDADLYGGIQFAEFKELIIDEIFIGIGELTDPSMINPCQNK
jgi:hypothetical protein